MTIGWTLIKSQSYTEMSTGPVSVTVPSHDGNAVMVVVLSERHSGGTDRCTNITFAGGTMRTLIGTGRVDEMRVHCGLVFNPSVGANNINFTFSGSPTNDHLEVWLATDVTGFSVIQNEAGTSPWAFCHPGDTAVIVSSANSEMTNGYTTLYDETFGSYHAEAAYRVPEESDGVVSMVMTSADRSMAFSLHDVQVGGVRITDYGQSDSNDAINLFIPPGAADNVIVQCSTQRKRDSSEMTSVTWAGSEGLTKKNTFGSAPANTIWEITNPTNEGSNNLTFAGSDAVTVKIAFVLTNTLSSDPATANEYSGTASSATFTCTNPGKDIHLAFGQWGCQYISTPSIESGWGGFINYGDGGSNTNTMATFFKYSPTPNDACDLDWSTSRSYSAGAWSIQGNPGPGFVPIMTFFFSLAGLAIPAATLCSTMEQVTAHGT